MASPARVAARVQRLQAHVVGSDAANKAGAAATGAGAGAGATTKPTTCFSGDPFADIQLQDRYDYIVVGAGTCGCILAARLSEDPKVSVLLIEAGSASDENMDVTIIPKLIDLQRTELDWSFEVPDKELGRTLYIPRGKVLGGSSCLNACAYVRGSPANYDGWARDGCEGWSYKDVLPYFKKSEHCVIPGADPKYHGTNGPWTVTDVQTAGYENELARKFVDALKEQGMPELDYNAGVQEGVGIQQFNGQGGKRGSLSQAFLRGPRCAGNGVTGSAGPSTPAIERANLTVVSQAYVTKLLFQGDQVIGVAMKRGSTDMGQLAHIETTAVWCNREVLVAGGAFNSPWLLMLSGIGPAEHLKEHSIPVVSDLPVGKNLSDHLFTALQYEATTTKPMTTRLSVKKIKTLAEYMLFKTGDASGGPLQVSAFYHSAQPPHNDDFAPEAADSQLHFAPYLGGAKFNEVANIADTGSHLTDSLLPTWGITFLPCLVRPRARGSVTLTSANPLDYPKIDFRFLSDRRDLEVLIEGMQRCRKAAKSKVYAGELKREVIDTTIPFDPESVEYLEEYVRKTTITVYHPVGTCKMGAVGDPRTVVDSRCRVLGVKGLRVVDASVMPYVISGNTNAPAAMVAEKAADMIKEDNA